MKKARTLLIKNLPYLCLIGVISLGLMTIVATGGGGGGSNGTQYEAQGTIGPEGGVVEVTDPESPIYGVKVIVTEDTFQSETIISIAVQENPPTEPLPDGIILKGTYISFKASVENFEKPILIMIPFEGDRQEDEMRLVFAYNDLLNQWKVVAPSPSPDPNTFTASVDHFSGYVKGIATISSNLVRTGFSAENDTHRYENPPPGDDPTYVFCPYDPGANGICNGMAVLAAEYFNNWADKEGESLHCRWDIERDANACCDARRRTLGADLTEEEWAALAYNIFIGAYGLIASLYDQSFLIDHIKFMAMFNKVVPIGMIKCYLDAEFKVQFKGHAVVATGWNKTGVFTGNIEIYDVNYNSQLTEIPYFSVDTGISSITRMDYKDWSYESLSFFMPINGTNIDQTVASFESQHLCGPDTGPPLPPQNLRLVSYGSDATLQWDANTEPDLYHYVLYWGIYFDPPYAYNSGNIDKSQTTCTVTGLSDDKTYYFAAKAVDTEGLESGYSNVVSINDPWPQPQPPGSLAHILNYK